ncbi:NapC/NirT family cytochrome c [Magnetospirillum sp. SS-4]|uniref:NapC/NirT family cytochrome c n=1 Tax=Magnetospirillum sp. SS-4 TaxID=2681465 RepID=UPI0013858136|nr:NapC/NirT family cytochrome c [Magnetospirillum sp. SS-4]CAA7626040.1 Cytochrome c-552 [Magnetospirillum sp. SS-4]
MATESFFSKLTKMKIMGASLFGAAVIFVGGIVFWGGFNTAMEATNTLGFCINCHEMKDNVYQEYKKTIHYTNRSGVRASCSDCHVPKDWVHKFVRKIQASGEVFHWLLGTVDTPEKFDGKRYQLAKRVWETMKSTDSRECRNCHAFDQMNPEMQKQRARKQHVNAQEEGGTCIDCHKGIAHKPVHHLLEQEEEQKAKEAEAKKAAAAKPAAPAPAPATAAAPTAPTAPAAPGVALPPVTGKAVDWSKVAETKTVLFYPGQTPIEWILTGTDHGGKRAFTKGDRCFECHSNEAADMGAKMVSGAKAEKTPIPGKRAAFPLSIKAAYDADNLYMRFEFPAGPHNPVPFAQGGKMDPDNEIKLAMMIGSDKVAMATQSGCWTSCHADSRDMPNAPAKDALGAAKGIDTSGGFVTKYVPESRTQFDTTKRDNWDKVKPQADLDALLAGGAVLDLTRYKSSGVSEQGYVLAERVLKPGNDVAYTGKKEGDKWVVTMVRRLKATQPGEVNLVAGQSYSVGFAVHDDYTSGRFHHVSLDLKLGLDAEGEIKASKM